MYGSTCAFSSDIFMVSVALIQAICLCQKKPAVKQTPFSAPLKAIDEISQLANAKYKYATSYKRYTFVLYPGSSKF